MPKLAALLLIVWYPMAATLAEPPVGVDAFSDCESQWAATPGSWAGFCYFTTAREHQLWAEGKRRIVANLASRPSDPYLRFILGYFEMNGGSVPEAVLHFHAAATAFAARADPEGEALARLNQGNCLVRQGLLEASGAVYRQAENAARVAVDPDLLVKVRIRQARLARLQGRDLERANGLLVSLQKELSDETSYQVWRPLLHERALVLQQLGRYREARRTNERNAELARAAGQRFNEATALSNVAVNVADMPPQSGTRQEAIRLARVALEAAERTANRAAAVTTHRLLGKLLPGAQGRAHLEKCLELTTAENEPARRTSCLFALAGNLTTTNPERARATLDQALALALASEVPWTEAYGWAERFRVHWATLSRDAAAADSVGVINLIEALRNAQGSEVGRAGFFTGWTEVYHSLAGHLLANDRGPTQAEIEMAFEVAERLRARVLLDSLAADHTEPLSANEAPGGERTAVLEAIVRVHRALQSPALGSEERTRLLVELEGLELDQAELSARPDATSLSELPETGLVTLAQVEEELAPDEALLVFLVAPDEDIFGKFAGGSWLLAVTASGTRSYRLPGRLELEVKVATFVNLGRRAARPRPWPRIGDPLR